MTLTVHPELEQGTDAWHDQRRGIVTASVVGRLLTTRRLTGIDYQCPACSAPANDPCRSKTKAGAVVKSPHPERAEYARTQSSAIVIEPASNDESRGLTLLLTAERITGWTEPTYMNDDMYRGVEIEPIARDLYSEKYAPVTEVGFMLLEEDGYRIGYSPDGLVGEDGLIEVKAPRAKGHIATILAGHPPADYMPQLQTGLLVSGRKWIDYVSYHGGLPMFVTRVYPQQKWFDAIIAAARNFEANAAEMVRIYEESIVGLHPTERRTELEMVI
jgi:hypothetical protein